MVKKKKSQIQVVELICAVNLALLVSVIVFTANAPWFNERTAVVASMLWLFSTLPALIAATYGLAGMKMKATRTRMAICWFTIAANLVYFAYMVQLFTWI